MPDKWIQTAITHHGVFRKAAEKAGMSTEAFARKHEHASGVLGHRARLALTLMHLSGAAAPPANKPKENPVHEHEDYASYQHDVDSAVKRHGTGLRRGHRKT